MANIKKIKLSNGDIYSIFDEGALRLAADGRTIITGRAVVDDPIIDGHLSIIEIDDIPLAQSNEIVLVQGTDGRIQKQNIRQVLRDLGVITASVENEILTLDTISISSL